MKTYLALDVGGTEIKSFIFREDGALLDGPHFYKALSDRSAVVIQENFRCIIQNRLNLMKEQGNPVSGIGFAFPGPFDYEKGICLMKGLGKYDSLYGMPIKEMLSSQFPDIPLAFANDADLFGLGEYHFGVQDKVDRVFYLCIGTGIGSCFIEHGQLVKYREDVPEEGWIFKTPCQDSIADEYLSVSGLMRMAAQEPQLLSYRTGKELAEAAYSGIVEAKEVFQRFGMLFTETVIPFAERFQAERLVVGGQIALSFSLFGKELLKACEQRKILLDLCPDSTLYAGKGTIRLFPQE